MKSKKLIQEIAEHTGFQPEPVEKVLYLQAILEGLCEQKIVDKCWVLKGGTALNLFHLELSRLSVDIDLNFIGVSEVSQLAEARKVFEQVLTLTCEREKCYVKRVPDSHAGGKFRLKYESEFGGSPNLEVDVNYLMRVPLLGVEERTSVFPPEAFVEMNMNVPVLTLEELAAGKFAALLDRFAARDVFDVLQLLNKKPDLLSDAGFRTAFMCYVGCGSKDVRKKARESYLLERNDVKQRLIPLLRQEEERSLEEVLCAVGEVIHPTIDKLLEFSDSENEFLDSLHQKGEIQVDLITKESDLQKKISMFPPLLWREKQVRKKLSS